VTGAVIIVQPDANRNEGEEDDVAGYSVKHRDDLETMEGSGEATWRLARKGLEEPSFGFNLVTIGPGGQIPEHDETASGQHELFVILEGEGTFCLDDEDHRAPAGTFARMSPETKRTIRNDSDAPVTALLIGVHPDGSYEAPGWA
jgi:quercetin dioxygenase-like cupin family protein